MNLEKAITEAIANQLVTGRKYQTEYGEQKEESQLTPLIGRFYSSNSTEIYEAVVKAVGEENIINTFVEKITSELESTNYSSYKWDSLIKETAPFIADKVAQKMYEDHKKDICKTVDNPLEDPTE